MIEAVNSVLSNAPLLRANAEQANAARSFASTPGAEQISRIPQAPFISPYISWDKTHNKAVLAIRDSDTGDILRQFPSQSRLEQINREQAKLVAARMAQASDASSDGNVGVSGIGDAPQAEAPASNAGIGFVAEAQVASAALVASSRSGSTTESAGVSVLA